MKQLLYGNAKGIARNIDKKNQKERRINEHKQGSPATRDLWPHEIWPLGF